MINKKTIYKGTCATVMALTLALTSCTEYLDKTADSDVSEVKAFQNFQNFQGFIEEIYNCIPNKEACYWVTTFNWGEDEIMNEGEGNPHFSHQMDLGNYRNWMTNVQTFLGGSTSLGGTQNVSPTSTDKFEHRMWDHAWYCIRKANIGLKNISLLQNASQEEKDLIAGQLYFFRAWWHEELMLYFGGLPYITEPLNGSQQLTLPRLSFQECAKLAAADFQRAADLLPNNWDDTNIGKQTLGKNELRITKVCALAYKGKMLLWAASPLMEHGVEMNAAHTYDYNKTLAAEAAEALGQALIQVNNKLTPYELASYSYDADGGLYRHIKAAGTTNSFTDIFYTVNQSWKLPGTTEAILREPYDGAQFPNGGAWNFQKVWGSKVNGIVEHDKVIHMPTANYVNYAYGMADGTPAYIVQNGELVPNPNSSFDPNHPFRNRDPRFYHDIVFDGARYIDTDIPKTEEDYQQQYFRGYTGSIMRDPSLGSRTGYFCQKLCDRRNNKYDQLYEWSPNQRNAVPWLRLADVYLMYAEAVAACQGPEGTTAAYPNLSAKDAINTLRDRVGAGHVSEQCLVSNSAFMDEVRRERACELAFEGFRWNDLQRWLLLTVKPFNQKMSQEFQRTEPDSYYESGNPKSDAVAREAQVTDWHMEKICDRQLAARHYWFPLPDKEVYLYESFGQNPGW